MLLAIERFLLIKPSRTLRAAYAGVSSAIAELGRSHSASLDHRRQPETLRTAMATVFLCPTNTTSRFRCREPFRPPMTITVVDLAF